jgi:hypothetical protein
MRNPASFAPGAGNALAVNFWSRVMDQRGGEHDKYEWTLDLTDREWLLSERKAVSSSDPYLEIAPNSTLRIWTTLRCPSSEPKNYLAQLVYYAVPLSGQERQKISHLVVGEYHSDTTPLVITGPVKGREPDWRR